ncbi:host specificity factor TipJ family phage tail protein [Pseudacidovorax intermedius]|uniref:Uncharacterized protein n=1 Tax=Pseudacidovorax intermedius TaxID=433924 RepID=A0A147GQE3_9BURK|nr:host specificity factor TipJ family phage tail protein [Pseudacidovorax intermedius]KTT17971.1 hypothetical protein NS331_16575 [Pseudacidovorax intermedius]
MLTICHDPAGALGRDRYALDCTASLQENIQRHLRSGADCRLLINGQEVDPATDPRLDLPPHAADEVVVVRRPGFGIDAIYYLYAAYAVLTVYSIAAARRAQGSANASPTGSDSPNNSLTAQTNIARAYQAIPDVHGYRRCWPDLIQPSIVEYIDNIKYITEWLCVSRGRGDISDVRYAESPIGDIAGASYEIFGPVGGGIHPENGTTTLLDVLETYASDEVNGQEMAPSVPFTTVGGGATITAEDGATTFRVAITDNPPLADLKSLAPTGTARVRFTITPADTGAGTPAVLFDQICTVLGYVVSDGICTFTFSSEPWDTGGETFEEVREVNIAPQASHYSPIGPFTLPVPCDRIRWNTVFLRGLKGLIKIRAEWWAIDGAGAEIPGTRQSQDQDFTHNTYDQRFYTTTVVPAAGFQRYRVQFTRITEEFGEGGVNVAKLEELYAMKHYPSKVLPGVTVIRVTTKATTEATGFSDRKFNCRWLRHCRVLFDNVNIGPTRNFARSMAHMWTLAGNDLAELDVDRLNAINVQLGETSPLLRFDASLDDAEMSLGERMQMAADAARCTVWRDGTRWTVTRDQARSYPELQLDYRNLAAGGDGAISYAAHMPASNDGVELEYVDEATQAKKSYVRLTIADGSVSFGESRNALKVKLPACTTYAQALNRAQLEARKLLFQRVTVSDKAMNDAGVLGLGSLVRWVDPADFAGDDGLQAGEVMAIAGNVIRTSEPLDWKGFASGRMLFTGANGRRLGAPVVCTPVAGGVQLASVPAGLYVRSETRQLGSRYAFAVGLTEGEMEAAGLYVCTSIRPDGKGNMDLALAEYDDRIYADD